MIKFMAKVKLFKYNEEEGYGRRNPFTAAGYLPHLVPTTTSKADVEPLGVRFLGPLDFDWKEVELEAIYPGVDYSLLCKDMCFEIREGRRCVGFGIILLELGVSC